MDHGDHLLMIENDYQSTRDKMNDLFNNNEYMKAIQLITKYMSHLSNLNEIPCIESIDIINKETDMILGLIQSIAHIEDTEHQESGLTNIYTTRSQLLRNLMNGFGNNDIIMTTYWLVKFWLGVIRGESSKTLNLWIDEAKIVMQLFSINKWTRIVQSIFYGNEMEALMKQLSDVSIEALHHLVTDLSHTCRVKCVINAHRTTLICGLDCADDFLFNWMDDNNERRILDLFVKMIEKFKLLRHGTETDIIGVSDILNLQKMDNGEQLIKDICEHFKIIEFQPWWQNLPNEPRIHHPRKLVKKDRTTIQIKQQTTSEPSYNVYKLEQTSNRLSSDDSFTNKETIIYHCTLDKYTGIIPNDNICDYFRIEIKYEPNLLSLVEGTNMITGKWYHARFYYYFPLDNQWRYIPQVIRMISKVDLGTDAKGSFRNLYKVQWASTVGTFAGKRFRPERAEYHSIEYYMADVRSQKVSQYYARKFTEEHGDKYVVEMVDAVHVQVFETSECTKVIDFFNLEFRAPSDWKFQKFTNNANFVNTEINTDLATAFGHYSFLKSEHKLLVVDLQGWSDVQSDGREELTLTDPALHAPMWDHPSNFLLGPTNWGVEGFHRFWKQQHPECNDICRELGLERPFTEYF